jgi:prepilin-type N-terminal cleavage/methylation domain-containing protein
MRYPTSNIRHPIKPAFTLVELLIALAITAMLLTAVAVAFNASVINYTENEKIYKALNGARQAMFRITSQLRDANAVAPYAPDNECTLITAKNEDLTYRYDASAKILYVITNDDTTDPDYKLCENVEAMTFTKEKFVVVEDTVEVTKVRSVQMTITVSAGGLTKKLAAAAVIRRNLD